MTKPDFAYVTFIATTPDKVWRAITDPAVTRQYWKGVPEGHVRVNVSDWKTGSRWEHQKDDATHAVDLVGTIIESSPPRRLVLTWGRPEHASDAAKHSRVTFEIEPLNERLVRLTVLHEDLKDDAKMLAGISAGWPMVLSNLKTLLETGRSL